MWGRVFWGGLLGFWRRWPMSRVGVSRVERFAMSRVEGLALYQYNSCPYCARVRSAFEELGLEIELRDTIAERERALEVVRATGRSTVPVLRIEEEDGTVRWMPESRDIVAYLRQRFS